VCHAEGDRRGWLHTFQLPRALALTLCIRAALSVRGVALMPVRRPLGPFRRPF
jgi:hypothetical protein